MRVSCRLTRERELGSDARLPHIELYNLFVINIFERPQGVRSSSTTLSPPHASRPSPALPRLADPCHPSQHTHDISSHAWLHVIPTVSTLCLRAAAPLAPVRRRPAPRRRRVAPEERPRAARTLLGALNTTRKGSGGGEKSGEGKSKGGEEEAGEGATWEVGCRCGSGGSHPPLPHACLLRTQLILCSPVQ